MLVLDAGIMRRDEETKGGDLPDPLGLHSEMKGKHCFLFFYKGGNGTRGLGSIRAEEM